MANKDEILQAIRNLAIQNEVTKEDIVRAYDEGKAIVNGKGSGTDQILTRKLGIAEILYYIGGAIVFLGISILIAQNWSTFSLTTKLMTTLGSGIAAYFVGVILGNDQKTEVVASAFYMISALVMPLGLFVLFDSAGFDAGGHGAQSFISGILLATYLASYFTFKKNIFTLFNIIFGTWFFFSLTSFMVDGNPLFDSFDYYQYRIFAVGMTYIFLGYSFSKTARAPLTGALYGFGILGFLGSALILGGWTPNQNVFWELIFPGLVFGALFLSVYIKSKAFLTWGTIFLMIYILKITSEYFASGMGWPLALVLAGLAMIGVGYMSISIKKKYL